MKGFERVNVGNYLSRGRGVEPREIDDDRFRLKY